MRATKIHIGTSGWSYQHWRDIFYPSDLAATSYLSFFASRFSVAEINTSFYHLPRPETVKNWASTVPKDFLFCPKISRYITHIKKLHDPEDTLPKFFDVFEPVRRRLGPVLIQLPEAVRYHENIARPFFATLVKKYPKYRFALEVRHASWLTEEALAILRKYHISLVIAESGDRWPYSETITGKDVYLRFHGPDGSYASSYSGKALHKYARKCIDWATAGHTVWVFFNNDINGYALKNAATLRDLIAAGR
ncbi:MAG TPA: DUF72 domain-containing protein [Puia sp.]|jgi:uncharacterized protein YecE (DUF72 family)